VREQRRVAPRHHHHRHAEPDLVRHCGREGQGVQAVEQRRVRRRAAERAVERPEAVEPERLRAHRVGGDGARVGAFERLDEADREARLGHGRGPYRRTVVV
jgi:hypothetical protein